MPFMDNGYLLFVFYLFLRDIILFLGFFIDCTYFFSLSHSSGFCFVIGLNFWLFYRLVYGFFLIFIFFLTISGSERFMLSSFVARHHLEWKRTTLERWNIWLIGAPRFYFWWLIRSIFSIMNRNVLAYQLVSRLSQPGGQRKHLFAHQKLLELIFR